MEERTMTLRELFVHTLTAMKDIMEARVDRFTVRELDDSRTLVFEVKLEDPRAGVIRTSALPEAMRPGKGNTD
jgi:hypothetical protein